MAPPAPQNRPSKRAQPANSSSQNPSKKQRVANPSSSKPHTHNHTRNNNSHGARRRGAAGSGSYEVQAVAGAAAGSSRIRRKIRDTERVLRNGKFLENNAEKRAELERALQALRAQLADAQALQRARDTATKYHKIRFVERKKALRRVLQQVKALAADETPNSDKDTALLRALEVDLYYSIVFPRSENYVSLYPTADEPEDARVRDRVREAVRREIRKLMDVEVLPSGFVVVEDSLAEPSEETNEDGDDEEPPKQPLGHKKAAGGPRASSRAVEYADELRRNVVDNGQVLVSPQIVSAERDDAATEKPGLSPATSRAENKAAAGAPKGEEDKDEFFEKM